MIFISRVLTVVGTILLIIGVLGGIYISVRTESLLSALSFTPFYVVGAVVLHAFAELLDSVNAIRHKLVGEPIKENHPIVLEQSLNKTD